MLVLLPLMHEFDIFGLISENLSHVLITKHSGSNLYEFSFHHLILSHKVFTIIFRNHTFHSNLHLDNFLLALIDFFILLVPISFKLIIILKLDLELLFSCLADIH